MSAIAFYTGTSGMIAFQRSLDVTAHNIANVNTNGYKPRRAAFDDLLRSRIATNVAGNHLVGHGVKQEFVDQIMGQSSLNQTAYGLDFALAGDGFFAVDNRGTREYTRNGAFDISVEGGASYLVTNDRAYVLDAAGNRIQVPRTADGGVNTEGIKERLGIFRFPNQFGLTPQNNARFTPNAVSGAAFQVGQAGTVDNPLDVLQGVLEFSGVDLGKEMVNMITQQRAFQMNARVVQTADQISDLINNLR